MKPSAIRRVVGVIALSIGVLGLSFGVHAAPTFVNAADPDLPDKARGVPKGGALRVHDLELAEHGTVSLELERFDVFATDAKITVVYGGSPTDVNPPTTAYFRGHMDTDPDAVVMLAVSEKKGAHGVISNGSDSWMMQTKNRGVGLKTRRVDAANELEDKTFECGADKLPVTAGVESAELTGPIAAASLPVDVQHTAHMIVDTDYEYFWVFGNAPDALEYMGDLFAYASSVYEREIDTNLLISQARLFATNDDPYSATNAGCGGVGALDEVQAEWNTGPKASIPRTLVHLLSGKDVGQGCAYVGVLCHISNGYGASMGIGDNVGAGGSFDIDDPTVFWDTMVVAHEIGHNFDSPHTHAYCNVAGNANPIDNCTSAADACIGTTPRTIPGLGTLTGGVDNDGIREGTLMSYCHQQGWNNVAYTFGEYHAYGVAPYRVPDRMRAHVSANTACMSLNYTGPDLRVFKDCKPDDPMLTGDTGICTITVENVGTTNALGVTAVDNYLSNGTFDFGDVTVIKGDNSWVTDPDSPAADDLCTTSANSQVQSGSVSCDLGLVDVGHTAIIKIEVTADTPQNINDLVTIYSDTDDPNPANNTAEDELNVVATVDIVVSKVCKPDSPYVIGSNDPEPYCDITVQNLGQATATEVRLTDDIISLQGHQVTGTSIVPLTTALNCTINAHSATDTTVTCDPISLTPNETAGVHVSFTSAVPGEVNDTASATTTAVDTNGDNNGKNNPAARGTVAFIEDADVSVSKVCTPATEPQLPGVEASCTITVTNHGPSEASSVAVQDKLLSIAGNPGPVFDLMLVTATEIMDSGNSFTVACTPTTGTVNVPEYDIDCPVTGVMSSGDQFTVKVDVVSDDPIVIDDEASVSSTTPDSALGNNTANGQVSFRADADLEVTKTASDVAPIAGGASFTYDIAVTNHGPSMAHNVVVTDQVPAGFLIESVVSALGNCVTGVAGSTPTKCTFDTMGSGNASTMTITVQALPDTRGQLSNDASVASDTPDGNNANNLATANVTVNGQADMAVDKSMTSGTVVAGALVDYTVTVTNGGPSTATGTTLVDVLDGDGNLLTFVSAKDASDNEICTESPVGTLTCELGTLQPLESFDVFITALVDPGAVGETIDNDATVSANEFDPNTPNVAHVDNVAVEGADLWIDKTGNFPTGNPSGTILYYLTVYNREGCSEDDPQVCGTGGPSNALDVEVIDYLPSTAKKLPVEFVSENCTYNKGSHTVTCTEPVLNVGDSVTFEIQVRAKGGLGEITNTAQVSSSTPDPDTGNNTDDLLMTVKGGTGDTGGPGGGRGKGGGKK